MQDLKELYQEVILDHNRNPRNFRPMEHASCEAKGHNPLCGDQLKLFLKIEKDVIQDVSFEGKGCAISQASASIMTEVLQGLSCEEAKALFEKVHLLLTDEKFDIQSLPFLKLQVLAGVRVYPARVKCASLAWHTLIAALKNQSDIAKTE
jgi:nitrogen fixation protein NifU and related proteins